MSNSVKEQNRGKAKYDQRVVCFIDILGFTEKVNQSKTNGLLLNGLADALSKIGRIGEKIERANGQLAFMSFSDSIILSAPTTAKDVLSLMVRAEHLSVTLARLGVFLRGAIVCGEFLHQKNLAFGPASETYRIRARLREVPRIILSKSARDTAAKFRNDPIFHKYYDKFVRQDEDGCFYIDFISFLDGLFLEKDPAKCSYGLHIMREIRGSICAGLTENDDPRIIEKYDWLAARYNDVVGKNKADAPELERIDPLREMSGPADVRGDRNIPIRRSHSGFKLKFIP